MIPSNYKRSLNIVYPNNVNLVTKELNYTPHTFQNDMDNVLLKYNNNSFYNNDKQFTNKVDKISKNN